MSESISGDSLGGGAPYGQEPLRGGGLGRIGGKLLKENLLRNGVDLAFDGSLLYLKVQGQKQGYASTNDSSDPQWAAINEPPYDDGDPNYQRVLQTSNTYTVDDVFGTSGLTQYSGTGNTVTIVWGPNATDEIKTGVVNLGIGDVLEINDFVNGDYAITLTSNWTTSPSTLGYGLDLTASATSFPSTTAFLQTWTHLKFISVRTDVVDGRAIGINTDNPFYELHIDNDVKSNNVNVTGTAYIDNHIITNNRFSASLGALHIYPGGATPVSRFNRITSDGVDINGNILSTLTNQNLNLDPNGTGTIELQTDTSIIGSLGVTGNITLDGNLSTISNLIIGDAPVDAVVINTDLTQDIVPGDDNQWDLGTSLKRWAAAYVPDWSKIGNIIPESALVSDQMYIGGPSNQITTTQSNEDLFISPGTGITFVEQIKIEGNNFTNLIQTAELDATAVRNGIESYIADPSDPLYSFWGTTVSGLEEFVAGPGSLSQRTRVSLLADIRNDVDNPNIVNTDDANTAYNVGTSNSTPTRNEQLWYYSVIKPYIYANGPLYAQYGNGFDIVNKPISIGSTGTGYTKFSGDVGFVIPSGTSAERKFLEIGETRWNTDLGLLECFDGQVYIVATGPGAVVTTDVMTELAISRTLTFG